MKNRVITIICSLIGIVMLVLIVYISINIFTNKEEDKKENTEVVSEDTSNTENNSNNSENNEKEEEIMLDSKIGVEVTKKLDVSNTFSSLYYKELETNGLTDKAKLTYTLQKINFNMDYSNYLRENGVYPGYYITANDMEKVAKEDFVVDSPMKHQDILDDNSYDTDERNYVIISRGVSGDDFNYVVEIPYKITTIDNKIYMEVYRMYLTRNIDTSSSENIYEGVEKNILYYDSNRQNMAYEIEDEIMSDEYYQKDILKGLVDNNKINKDKLAKYKYTIITENSNYKIENIEKI